MIDLILFRLSYMIQLNFIGHSIILILIYVKADGHYLIKIYCRRQRKIIHIKSVTTTGDISKTFLPGHTVTGSVSGSTGTVIKRYLDLGQIIIDSPNNFNAGETLTPSINGVAQTADIVLVSSGAAQYNAVHHYENASGEYVDIGLVPSGTGTGAFPTVSSFTPITYFERITAKNDSLKEIKVLSPDVAAQVKTEFNKLLLRG